MIMPRTAAPSLPHVLESIRDRPKHSLGALGDECGFTIVEVLVSILILVAGMLGTVMLINAANATTLSNNLRETANNLSREVAEAANGLTYAQVTSSALVPALQAQPGLADASSASGWDIVRHGITYTLTATACRVDDSADSQGAHPASSDPPYCATSTGSGDQNPDDYRRVTVDVTWTNKNLTKQVRQVVVVSKTRPSAFIPPQVRGVSMTSCSPTAGCNSQALGAGQVSGCYTSTCTMSATSCTSGSNGTCATTVNFTVTTANSPASVKWAVDGAAMGNASGSGDTWTFTWTLGTNYPQTPVDGTYEISAQAYDAAGAPGGDPVGLTVTLNRFTPDITTNAIFAGRNPLFADNPEIEVYPVTSGARVDRDVVGYTTYRYRPNGSKIAKELVSNCSVIAATSCMDAAMPSGQSWIEYETYPDDVAPDGNEREAANGVQCSSTANEATCSRNVLSSNTRPTAPSNLTANASGNTVTLNWNVPTDNGGAGDPDSSDCVDTFRIYRTPTTQSSLALGDRYDRTPFGVVSAGCGTTASNGYVDLNAGGTQHKYWITSVDTRLAESTLLGPVTQ
jgi:Tfp pilus assembly protein PilV